MSVFPVQVKSEDEFWVLGFYRVIDGEVETVEKRIVSVNVVFGGGCLCAGVNARRKKSGLKQGKWREKDMRVVHLVCAFGLSDGDKGEKGSRFRGAVQGGDPCPCMCVGICHM